MMIAFAIAAAMLAAQEPDIILTERPVPLSWGAEVFATCGRLEVTIRYRNTWEGGLQELEGEMAFSRKKKIMSHALSNIKARSGSVHDVGMACEAENVMAVEIDTTTVDGQDIRWRLIVNEMLEVSVESSEPVDYSN